MMEKLQAELCVKDKQSADMRVRASVLAKRDLMHLLIKSTGEYVSQTDTQLESVFEEIMR